MSLYCPNPLNEQYQVNPSVNCVIQVIMFQYRFISCNKCTTLGSDDDDGGGCTCVGQWICRKFYLPLNFAVNLKLLKKYSWAKMKKKKKRERERCKIKTESIVLKVTLFLAIGL